MKKLILRLMACALAVGAFGFGAGAERAHAAIAPEPDAAYCAYTQVQGTAMETPAMTSSVLTRAETITIQANCVGAGDESGLYTLSLTGSNFGNCGAADGSGTVTGTTPEGAMSGTYTYARPGVHYYINGSYAAAGESHSMQLWMDIVPPVDPQQACFYSVASLIGHGAFADLPQGDNVDTIDFTGNTTALTPVQLVGGSGTFAFGSNLCEMVSPPEAGSCSIAASGTYVNIICGTGTVNGTANISGPDGTETMTFSIAFAQGSGTLTGNMSADDGPATVAGTVEITPTGGNCASGVTQFQVAGHLTITP
jgi:hypothetical protein